MANPDNTVNLEIKIDTSTLTEWLDRVDNPGAYRPGRHDLPNIYDDLVDYYECAECAAPLGWSLLGTIDAVQFNGFNVDKEGVMTCGS